MLDNVLAASNPSRSEVRTLPLVLKAYAAVKLFEDSHVLKALLIAIQYLPTLVLLTMCFNGTEAGSKAQ
jgi:hypothetical protein